MTREEALGKMFLPNFPGVWKEEGKLRLEELEKDGFTVVPIDESLVDYLVRVRKTIEIS